MRKKLSAHPKALYQLRKVTRVLALVIIVFFVIGFFLPTDYQVKRSVVVNKPSDSVLHVMLNGERLPDWMYINNGKLVAQQGQLTQGDKVVIGYNNSDDKGSLTFTAVTPSKVSFDVKPKINVDIVRNTILVKALGNKTELDWEISGKLKSGFLSPYIAFFANKIAGRNFEQSLQRLKEKVEVAQ